MPIVLGDTSGIAEGIQTAGGALAQALEKRAEKRLVQERKNILDKTIQGADFATEKGQKRFLSEATQAGIPVKDALGVLKQMRPSATERFFSRFGLDTQDQPVTQEVAPTVEPTVEQPAYNITQEDQQRLDQIPDDALAEASASDDPALRNFASFLQNKRKEKRKEFVQDREFHTKVSDRHEKRMEEQRVSLPKKKMAFNLAKEAVESGETGPWSWANIARRTGISELQNLQGAKLDTAAKEHFIPTMGRLSAKAQNMYLEKMISNMFAKTGDTREAGLGRMAILEGERLLDEAELKISDELSQEDESKYGYVRKNISRRVAERVAEVQDDILKETSFSLRRLQEQEKGTDWMFDNYKTKVPNGTPLTPEMAAVMSQKYNNDYSKVIKNAKKLGYRIPTPGEKEKWL